MRPDISYTIKFIGEPAGADLSNKAAVCVGDDTGGARKTVGE